MNPPQAPVLNDYIDKDTVTVKPDGKSHLGLHVPEIVFTYGKKEKALPKLASLFPIVLPTLSNVQKSYKSVRKNPAQPKSSIDRDLLRDLEKYVKKLGCDQIGYTIVPEEYIFSNKEILYSHAIVLTMEMDSVKISKAPRLPASREVWSAYRDLGIAVNKLADFLRENGYSAQAGPALGGDVNYPLLAQKAGIGQIGKHGLLISEKVGPRQRIAAVYTNISNLPYSDSNKHQWVESYCDKCGKCIRECPAGAIYSNKKVFDDGTQQYINYKRCAIPFSEHLGCSICIKECTFNTVDYEVLKRKFNA